ncbi:cell envelope integrity EipB family protein [Kaistia algarum]|uniref:cell envelope integrity EipB family protein n=1 Tax=Kaistia algarum TaxID=2083279 RepID=UPI0022533407|nr:cell envelope integrity EipB family protein [Kaistia algarum]MCX5514549.1 cell envelope integrity EipB family protein [Kaistia algarum]
MFEGSVAAMPRCRAGVLLLALAAVLSPLPALALPAMVAHRAVYDLVLDMDNSSDKVSDAEGRMVYEFAGSACEGYTTKLRFVTRVSDEDGNARLTDVATTTFEDVLGKTFNFSTKSFVDGTISEDSTGTAERIKDKVEVKMAKPKARRFEITRNFQFPNQHLQTIIDAALRGEHFMQIDLFDGSDKGEKVYATSAVIGKLNSGADDFGDEAVAKSAGIDKARHWPVTISYFDGPVDGEQSPTYELSFILYENGITRRMRFDYGDFALTGKLVKLDLEPVKVSAKNCR